MDQGKTGCNQRNNAVALENKVRLVSQSVNDLQELRSAVELGANALSNLPEPAACVVRSSSDGDLRRDLHRLPAARKPLSWLGVLGLLTPSVICAATSSNAEGGRCGDIF